MNYCYATNIYELSCINYHIWLVNFNFQIKWYNFRIIQNGLENEKSIFT